MTEHHNAVPCSFSVEEEDEGAPAAVSFSPSNEGSSPAPSEGCLKRSSTLKSLWYILSYTRARRNQRTGIIIASERRYLGVLMRFVQLVLSQNDPVIAYEPRVHPEVQQFLLQRRHDR